MRAFESRKDVRPAFIGRLIRFTFIAKSLTVGTPLRLTDRVRYDPNMAHAIVSQVEYKARRQQPTRETMKWSTCGDDAGDDAAAAAAAAGTDIPLHDSAIAKHRALLRQPAAER